MMGTLMSGFGALDASVVGQAVTIAWKGAALLVLTGVATMVLARGSAALRHLLWALGIVGVLALPVIAASLPWSWDVLPAWGSVEEPSATTPAIAVEREAPAWSPVTGVEGAPPAAAAGGDATVPAPSVGREAAGTMVRASTPSDVPAGGWAATRWLFIAWAMVAGLLALHQLAGRIALAVLTRRGAEIRDPLVLRELGVALRDVGVRRRVRLLFSGRVRVPMTWGVRRPVVLLPAAARDWTGARLRVVLQHELAHVRRLDALTDTLADVACTLYWFNPLVWWAAARLRAESEQASDDLVLGSGARASDYAGHLLALVTQVGARVAPAGALPLAQRSRFEGRLLAILDPSRERRAVPRGSAWTLGALSMVTVVLLGAASPAPAQVEAPDGRDASSEQAQEPAAREAVRDAARPPAASAETPDDERRSVSDHAATAPPTGEATPRGDEADAVRDAEEQQADGRQARGGQADAQGARQPRDTASVRALTQALRTDESEEVRRSAAWALGQIQDRAATEALSQAARTDASLEVRRTAIWAMGQIQDPAAVPALEVALSDEDTDVRSTALWALGQLQSREAVGPLVGVLRDPDANTRKTAVWALGQIQSREAVGPLLAALDDEDVEVREQVVWALGQIQSREAVDGLAATLRGDTDVEVRRQAAWALGQIQDDAALPALADALSDPDPSIARTAAWAIGQVEPSAAPPELLDLASSATGELRSTALWALAQIEDPASVPVFVEALRDADPNVRGQALRGLGRIRDEAAIRAVADLLDDADPEVRAAAARALAGRGNGWGANPQPRPQPRPRPRPNGN